MAGNTDNPNGDILVQQPPNDSISSLIFSPAGSFMAAGSWNKEVRFWEVGPQGQTAPKAVKAFGGPILSIDFSPDGQNIFAAGCDKTVQLWNIAQNQASLVAQHDAPIKFCKYVADGDFLVTGSWDKTVRFWDLRQRKCAANVQLPERVYAMDVTAPLLTMAMAGRQIAFFDSRNPSAPVRKSDSPLKMQSRCVANFPSSRDGCALGSIEGRVAIHHVEDKSKRNFSFKCHRQDNNTVFAVNAICFHPYGTFATAGSDGGYTFWDKDSKQRLKLFKCANNAITAASFNRDGTIFAYAIGYDWSKGIAYADRQKNTQIFLHGVRKEEIEPRPKT